MPLDFVAALRAPPFPRRAATSPRLVAISLIATLAGSCKEAKPIPSPAPSTSRADAPSPSIPSAPPPTGTASALAAPASPPAPITDATAALVWQAGGGGFKTVWVEAGAAGVVVKRERNEAVVATRKALFALRITRGPTSLLTAEPLGVGASIGLESASVESCGEKDAEADVRLVGAAGSVVFTSSHGWIMTCDAMHPMFNDSDSARDLDSDAPLALSPFPGLPRLAAIARGKFVTAFGDDGGGCLTNPTATPDLYHADFAYDGRGVLRGHYVFTMDSNYMCGNGPGHYVTPQEVFDSALPDAMTRWKKTPTWLAPYLAKPCASS